jgi:hypothetical protein
MAMKHFLSKRTVATVAPNITPPSIRHFINHDIEQRKLRIQRTSDARNLTAWF